jgi:hypothetical protein
LLSWAPGGETFEESAARLRELLQDFDQQGREAEDTEAGEKLDRIEEGVRALTAGEIPRLRNEIQELRKMLADPE